MRDGIQPTTWRLVAVMLALATLTGCRLPGWDGPISPSLVDSRNLSRQGVSAMERGDTQQAESLLAKAVRACPSDSEARQKYAEVLWHRGAKAEAIVQIEEATKLAKEDSSLRVRLAEMYFGTGRLEQAAESAQLVLAVDPKSASAWAIRGGVRKAMQQHQEALADYLHASSLDPMNRTILFEVAELYREMGQPDRALRVLQTLADSYPAGEAPQQVLCLTGSAYSALGRHNDAVESLRMAVQREPSNADILYQLAEAELQAGHAREASEVAHRVLAMQPKHSGSMALLQQVEIAQHPRDSWMK